ncbi:MAG: RnfABCDGE type electron transport complex subunit A [Clostridia bacterium]|nr:RnfABCDGE type electron transport complex subunit A [Clostridia bacterium]
MEILKTIFVTLITTTFVNNVVLSQFLGLCPFLGVSKSTKTAAGMGGAVIFVITIASLLTSLVYTFILSPLGLEFLETIAFIVIIAALVQFVEMFLKKVIPPLYTALGVYLPLITTNCAVLGVALNNVTNFNNGDYSTLGTVLMSVLTGFGTAVGFAVAILIMAGIREKIAFNDVPDSFKGMPITLITAGLMAMAFFGFQGLI